MNEEATMNKMGTEPVNRLLITTGLPMIVSMVLQAAYNIVDSAFVSNMQGTGELALNALTLAFPVQILMVAIAVGTGVGTNALLAKSLGQGNQERASRAAGNAIFLAIVMYIVFLLFGLFGVRAYIVTQTTNEQIMEMAVEYLTICCVASFGVVFYSIFEKLLQATGRSLFSTTAQITGAVTNIILDPIFIYGLLGCPQMGVRGAALATVIGQIASFILALIFHLKFDREITNGLRYMKPSLKIVGEIYSIGLPAIVAQALMSFMTYGLNVIFVQIDETVVTAYGLYYKIQQFILFAAFGLRDAITPIISFNHGMRSKSRVKAGIRYGLEYTLIIMVAGLIIIEAGAGPLSQVFGLSGETQQLCIGAMRIVSISFLFAGINIGFQGIFQALDSGLESLVLSICRQLIFVLPVAWGFSLIARQNPEQIWLIWLTFPIAEAVTMAIGIAFLGRINKHKIEMMEG